jgi:hypothetical protein
VAGPRCGARPSRVEELPAVVGVRSGTWAPRCGDAGARGHCSVASARRLEQMRAARGRAEWTRARWKLQEEGMGFSFGPTMRG